MKLDKMTAAQIAAVFEGYESLMSEASERGDKDQVRYVKAVRCGFVRALRMVGVDGLSFDANCEFVRFDVHAATDEKGEWSP